MSTTIYTMGYTKKSAEEFFGKLRKFKVQKLIDIRLKNTSGLAGFAKKNDLKYFLDVICRCAYRHEPRMAPTEQILSDYKKKIIIWDEYVVRFSHLIAERRIETLVTAEELNLACFLCSEPEPIQCHRRLVAEYLQTRFDNIKIAHI